MHDRHCEFDQVYDVTAFRVLVESVADCYAGTRGIDIGHMLASEVEALDYYIRAVAAVPENGKTLFCTG